MHLGVCVHSVTVIINFNNDNHSLSLSPSLSLSLSLSLFHTLSLSVTLLQPNLSTVDWPLKATLTGHWFTGPSSIIVKASSTGYYPLTFEPRHEKIVKVISNKEYRGSGNKCNILVY